MEIIAYMIMFSPLLLVAMGIYWLLFGHRWKYRNPYDRTCKVCNRHEVSHCWDLKSWNRSWWEIFDEGDATKHQRFK